MKLKKLIIRHTALFFLTLAIIIVVAREGRATFNITANNSLNFDSNMEPGSTHYLNESVGIKSDQSAVYYFKISVIHPMTNGVNQSYTIPNSNLLWEVNSLSGEHGTLNHAMAVYQAFISAPPENPDLVYTSDPADINNSVNVGFIYKLIVPLGQLAGTYTTTITYLLTESL